MENTLRERVEDRLAAIGKKQRQLAKEVKVTPQTLNAWLKRNQIPIEHIFKVSQHLECSVSWLAGQKSYEVHLSENEKLLLSRFKELTQDQQERELAYLRSLVSQSNQKN
nr:DNA-binding protein [uncultured Mediterranean phage uvMED]